MKTKQGVKINQINSDLIPMVRDFGIKQVINGSMLEARRKNLIDK